MAKVSAMPAVTAGDVVDADEFYILDGGVSKKISAVNLAQISQITSRYVAQSTLTTDGDVLTRASGSPARITRADLAQDTAFSSRYRPKNDPLGWGFPHTSALLCGNLSVATVAASNYNWFMRVIGGGTISKIGIVVGTQSGNVCVGVVRPTGAGRAADPVTRIATSGSVACPATGYQEVVLTASVDVLPGDYFVLTADNTTATFQRGVLFSGSSSIFAGANYVSATDGFPIAATIVGAAAAGDRSFLMVGVA